MPRIETAVWRIKKKDHDKFASVVIHGPKGDDATGLAWQANHPEAIYYSRTRMFCRPIDGTDEEEWTFIDEYDSTEEYDQSHAHLYGEEQYQEMQKKLYQHTYELMTPDSHPGHIVWEEVPGTHMEFEDHRLVKRL